MRTLTSALCLALLPAFATAATPLATTLDGAEERVSLEELLERYRQEREKLFAGYRSTLNGALAEIEQSLANDRKERLPGIRAKLASLGSQAAPLLVDKLDPGAEASDTSNGSSAQLALVLKEMSTKSVSLDLLSILRKGSKVGQSNALVALSGSDDPERVGPVLREMFTDAHKDRRATLISAIANLGGEANFEFLGGVLTSNDPDLVKSALRALTESRCEAAAPKIKSLVENTIAAAAHVPEIVAYYRACPSIFDSEHCQSMVIFAGGLRANSKMAELVLAVVGENEDAWNSKIKRDLKQLAESSSNRVAEAALICLARTGDRQAKKKLLEPYDERIEKNDRIASAWQNRAEVKYRIGEYKAAIKDYEQAQKASAEYLRTEPEVYEGLARCYALLGKLKDSAKWLGEGGLSLARLHQLARDPDFAELAADSKYKKVFRLGED